MTTSQLAVQRCSYRTTLCGNQVRLGLPPKAAPAEGRPEGTDAPMNQSREAHLAARPLHSPRGGLKLMAFQQRLRRVADRAV